MAYASSTTNLFTRLHKTSVTVTQRRNDHTQVNIIIMECFQCCLQVYSRKLGQLYGLKLVSILL